MATGDATDRQPTRVRARPLSTRGEVAAGALSGATVRFVVAPLDVIKIRWQLQRAPTSALVSTRGVPTTATGTVYRGLLQTTQLLLREEGLRTLWRGNVPAMALYATYSSIQFSAFSSIMGDTRSASGTKDAERRMVAGAVAGVAATLATYPLDFMRTRLAAQGVPRTYTSLPHLISTVAREEGVRGFFKGVAPTCVQIAPYMALNFTIFGVLREALSPGAASDPSQHEGVSAVAGAVAGFTSKVAVYPLELAKRRLQVQGMQRHERYGTLPAYTGMLQCIRTTVREEGFAGLFKGCWPSLVKSAVVSSITFAAYDAWVDLLRRQSVLLR